MAIQGREAGELHIRQWLASDKVLPHVADDIEQVGASRGQQRVGAPHCLLHEHVIAQPLGSLDPFAQRIAGERACQMSRLRYQVRGA